MRHEPSAPDAVTAAFDPIDVHIGRLREPGRSTWSRISSQSALPILTGIALGPQGLAVLTPEILALLAPSVPVAMALLGVTVALARLDILSIAIAVAGVVLAVQLQPLLPALQHLAQAAAIAILLAAAGWILSSRGAEHDERRVFSIATFLLLGGVADYLAVPALLLGWIAAAALRAVRLSAVNDVRRDASYLQHAVTALLLIIAGAHVILTWQIAAIAMVAAAFVAAVGTLIHKPSFDAGADEPGLPPLGALIVALAMDAVRFIPRAADALPFVVVTVAVLDLLTRRRERTPA